MMAWQACGCVLRRPCEVTIGPRCIVQPVRPRWLCRRGAHLRGERWSPRELRQGIGKDEVEAMEILLGRSWSQDGVKLTLQPWVVEAKGLSTLRSRRLVGMQTKAGHRLDDGTDVGKCIG